MKTSEEHLAKFQTLSQVNKIFLLFQKFQTLTEMLFCMFLDALQDKLPNQQPA